jgi:hypothetical protein
MYARVKPTAHIALARYFWVILSNSLYLEPIGRAAGALKRALALGRSEPVPEPEHRPSPYGVSETPRRDCTAEVACIKASRAFTQRPMPAL